VTKAVERSRTTKQQQLTYSKSSRKIGNTIFSSKDSKKNWIKYLFNNADSGIPQCLINQHGFTDFSTGIINGTQDH
jgi:hypothetical protein